VTTKTELAEIIARSARLSARANQRPVTRLLLEEVAQELSHAPQYEHSKFPALRTLIVEAKRQATDDDRLDLS
jgi:predicted ATP-dependent protease